MTKTPPSDDSEHFEEDIIHEEDGMRIILRFTGRGGAFGAETVMQVQDEGRPRAGAWIETRRA